MQQGVQAEQVLVATQRELAASQHGLSALRAQHTTLLEEKQHSQRRSDEATDQATSLAKTLERLVVRVTMATQSMSPHRRSSLDGPGTPEPAERQHRLSSRSSDSPSRGSAQPAAAVSDVPDQQRPGMSRSC